MPSEDDAKRLCYHMAEMPASESSTHKSPLRTLGHEHITFPLLSLLLPSPTFFPHVFCHCQVSFIEICGIIMRQELDMLELKRL